MYDPRTRSHQASPALSVHDDIEAARSAACPDAERLKTYRRYARGDQRGTLSAQQQRVLRSLLGNRFCDNLCARALGEVRDRLTLAGFEVAGYAGSADADAPFARGGRAYEDAPPAVRAVLDYVAALWTFAALPELAGMVHFAALRDGDHAVSLRYNQARGRVVLRREPWWNGDVGTWVAYDDDALPVYAVRDWRSGTASGATETYRTVWRPHEIERYVKTGDGWKPHSLPSDPKSTGGEPVWPVPFTLDGTPEGEPVGLPVVHFRNVQVPQDGAGGEDNDPDPMYGASELAGGLLGIQDEVNDVQRDLTAAGRYAGYGMLWGTGLSQRVDDQGEPLAFHPEPGAFFEEPNKDAAFGQINPSSIEPLAGLLEIKHRAFAQGMSVPMHTISGEWPSGEALLRAEMPLVAKAHTIGRSFGPAWASLVHKATRLHNTYGPPAQGAEPALDEGLLIAAVFEPAERLDRLTELLVERQEVEIERARQALENDRNAFSGTASGPTDIESRRTDIERAADRSRTNGTPVNPA